MAGIEMQSALRLLGRKDKPVYTWWLHEKQIDPRQAGMTIYKIVQRLLWVLLKAALTVASYSLPSLKLLMPDCTVAMSSAE